MEHDINWEEKTEIKRKTKINIYPNVNLREKMFPQWKILKCL